MFEQFVKDILQFISEFFEASEQVVAEMMHPNLKHAFERYEAGEISEMRLKATIIAHLPVGLYRLIKTLLKAQNKDEATQLAVTESFSRELLVIWVFPVLNRIFARMEENWPDRYSNLQIGEDEIEEMVSESFDNKYLTS